MGLDTREGGSKDLVQSSVDLQSGMFPVCIFNCCVFYRIIYFSACIRLAMMI